MNTAQDIVAYLITSVGGGAQDGEHSAVRQAVVHGVREVMQSRNWLWHTKTGSFATGQISTVGNITAGSNQFVVANPTGFVPGRLVEIGAEYFTSPVKIVSVRGRTITVDGAATSSATAVTVTPQVYYDLPPNVKDVDALTTNTVGTLHCYITPQEWQRLEINTRGAGEPYYYTIMRSDLYPDRYQVRFVGITQDPTVVNYTYRYVPRPVKYMGYERISRQGTISIGVEGVDEIAYGTDTNFPHDCVDCMLRVGTTTYEPEAIGSLNPFLFERRIIARDNSSRLVLDRAGTPGPIHPTHPPKQNDVVSPTAGPDVAEVVDGNEQPPPAGDRIDANERGEVEVVEPGTRYCITDWIDASPTMWTAIITACEMWHARLAGKPAGDVVQLYGRDLRLAMENDVVSPLSGQARNMPFPTPRSAGWHSALRPDVE
jgi:hypothetical protein